MHDDFVNEVLEGLLTPKTSPRTKNVKTETLKEEQEIKVQDSGFIGSFNYVPDSRDYADGAQYRNVNEGIVYINKNNLWEEYVRDGKKGDTPRWSPSGGGLGERDVKKIANIASDYNGNVQINPFVCGDFSFDGGSISIPSNGTWYIGVELSSKQLRTLPRLGHSGWIPVAKVNRSNNINNISQITPVLPNCYIPNVIRKLKNDETINVVVMGSSLTVGEASEYVWPGMLFGNGTISKYKITNHVSIKGTGVGGSTNKYQLAQLGHAGSNTSYGVVDSGYSKDLTYKTPPGGRSDLFKNCDLIVIGCLANGGEYRLEIIEPLIRKIKENTSAEVIVITDNPHGPSLGYDTMYGAGLYKDADEIFRVSNLYGVCVADTASYVFDSYFRANGVGIYSDAIHQTTGIANGYDFELVSCGHESYARAIRSCFPYNSIKTEIMQVPNTSFENGLGNWTGYGSPSSITIENGWLRCDVDSDFDGVQFLLSNTFAKDSEITIEFDIEFSPNLAIQVGGLIGSWSTTTVAPTQGHNSITITNNQVGPHHIAFINFANVVGYFKIRNVIISGEQQVGCVYSHTPVYKNLPMPPIRVVTDLKTPSDVFVTLPQDIMNVSGILESHPWGASSFPSRFSTSINLTNNMLRIPQGGNFNISSNGAVGFYIIHYRDETHPPVVLDIHINNIKQKTVTITVPFGNEWISELLSPNELNGITPTSNIGNILNTLTVTVVSGELYLAANVVLTVDQTYIRPEMIEYVGQWYPKEDSRSGLPGYATDTIGSYAAVKSTGKRLYFVISANPGTKKYDVYSQSNIVWDELVTGNYHITNSSALYGPNEMFVIKCKETNPSGSQANGRSLHIGGAIVVNDR